MEPHQQLSTALLLRASELGDPEAQGQMGLRLSLGVQDPASWDRDGIAEFQQVSGTASRRLPACIPLHSIQYAYLCKLVAIFRVLVYVDSTCMALRGTRSPHRAPAYATASKLHVAFHIGGRGIPILQLDRQRVGVHARWCNLP